MDRLWAASVAGVLMSVSVARTGWTEEPGKALREQMQAAREQAQADVEPRREQIEPLRAQLRALRQHAQQAADESAKQQARQQAEAIRAQLHTLMEELAAFHTQQAEQGLTFAQHRLELAKARQAKLQNRQASGYGDVRVP